MNELLRELTNELYRLNDFLEKKAFSSEEIDQEEKNFEKIIETQKKLTQALNNIKKCSLENEDKFCEDIIELHTLTHNLAWYFENLNENIQKIIQHYPFSKTFLEKNAL